ncbi:NAD-dependent malic enzyme [Candidatus Shapirobacteria bacterium CG03_land_8_20_14_0_80_39_12]|uniref:NAD-dependent malic enzyme n=1 Tax=Candidatus Shapirobacteria bacterium CG03_land_8_20_14_0_80_39_12 TaxID=1974879 RepID=A0A2M7BD79_9BACT|nr:MAG: NAD-dependent malic enzyme [Candidatus Shapirobacteria bacterium CG03_land_8_20_14_0_80_39_12]
MDNSDEILEVHKKFKGKIATLVTTPVTSKKELSIIYTPGVAVVSSAIAQDKNLVFDYTIKGHTVAIVSDGTAVLGLGNIGPEAAMPVMEGKAVLLKTFADIDAFPICLNTQDPQQIINTVKYLAPTFGAINLEDISAPRCFLVEESLQDLGIPVMHDDQHGTAVIVYAGLINAAKAAQKELKNLQIVINGAGAAGNGVTKMLVSEVGNIIVLDSKGIISKNRKDLDSYKKELAKITNKENIDGDLAAALIGSDVFIGVSKPNLLDPKNISSMNNKPIIFALANPTPEIMPDLAKNAGAFIVATGRSDFSNQINNSLAFPGIFKGALSVRAGRITNEMLIAAAKAIANLVKDPSPDNIIPGPFEKDLAIIVAAAVSKAFHNPKAV